MEDIGDPLGDRVMKNVPMIAREPISKEQLWKKKSDGRQIPDTEFLRKHLLREGHINKPELMTLLSCVTGILKSEPNVMRIKEPVIIVGDIHGQYYDMIHMFEKVVDSRNLANTNMLFLGDYVDRGTYSIEVCIFLFALKI
jgi:serine/threonine-protein phosphatase 2B catalytic subunit